MTARISDQPVDGFHNLLSEQSEGWVPVTELARGSEEMSGLLVDSDAARKVMTSVARIAPYKTAVLVHGESGVGKELVSRAIHRQGPCPNGPFVTFNCSNLVESLAESQLFGHVKGAFTDAREESLGYFRSANGGTLFLDEIGELPLKLQPKLLRAVETHEVQAVGSSHTHKVEIRLVCATNRDLKAMVREGTFRADLYYRLNASSITIPPLRERRDGIPALVAHFIATHGGVFNKNIRLISRDALAALCAFEWPGNVRQLSHAIESALMMTDSNAIALSDLPESIVHPDSSGSPQSEESAADAPNAGMPMHSLDAAIDRASRDALTQALSATAGNCVRAAELLGVSRYTVYRMINRYGVASFKGRSIAPRVSVARL
jgi:two-component system, NtrC family, response regulator AtoC